MAEQTLPVISPRAVALSTAEELHGVRLPPRPPAATTSLTSKLGAALGFVSLAVLALLSLLVIARQRELRALRAQVAQALALEAPASVRWSPRPALGSAAHSQSRRQPSTTHQDAGVPESCSASSASWGSRASLWRSISGFISAHDSGAPARAAIAPSSPAVSSTLTTPRLAISSATVARASRANCQASLERPSKWDRRADDRPGRRRCRPGKESGDSLVEQQPLKACRAEQDEREGRRERDGRPAAPSGYRLPRSRQPRRFA